MNTSIKKQTVLLTTCLLLALTAQAQWRKVTGNGKMTTETRTTSNYDAIKCAGSFDFKLVSGNEGSIKIEAEENLMEYIVTEVKDNSLVIKSKNGANLKPSSNKNILITIPFEDISKISLAGSGDLWNEDPLNTSSLEVSLAGSGDIVLSVNTTSLKASVAGSGDVTLKGNTSNLDASVAGSGDFHGFELQSNNTNVSVAGSGDAEVVSKETLKARVAGSGDIVYKGSPKADTKVAGSGRITNN